MLPRYSALVILTCALPSCSASAPRFDTATTPPKPASSDASPPKPATIERVTLPLESERHERVVRRFLTALSAGDRETVRQLLATQATLSGLDGETHRKPAWSEVERFLLEAITHPDADDRVPNSPQGVEVMDTTRTPAGALQVSVRVSRPDSLRGVWKFGFETGVSAEPHIEEIKVPGRH